MKETWLYKQLNKIQNDTLGSDFHSETLTLNSIANLVIFFLLSIVFFLSPILWITTFILGIFKDLYDLYCYLNAEKIAKKEAIKRKLKLKKDIEKWLNIYEKNLTIKNPYYLLKKIYRNKKGLIVNRNSPYSQFTQNGYSEISIKEDTLSISEVIEKNINYTNFIFNFLTNYNFEYFTIKNNTNKGICDTHRRRSLHDIYLITKYYYPEVTFINVVKTIINLLNEKIIYDSYCLTVEKYVFYIDKLSNHNNFKNKLEFSDDIIFEDLINYFKNEK